MGYLGATLKQVFTRARRTDVSLRDVTIARDRKRGLANANNVTHRKRVEDFERFWKSQWVENWTPNETVDFRLLAETFVAGAPHVGWGADENASIERLCLSPYVEEPLNSKVIKGFVPEQRSRQVFSEFRDPMFCIIYVMNVPCTFRIFMHMATVQLFIYIYIYIYVCVCVCACVRQIGVNWTES